MCSHSHTIYYFKYKKKVILNYPKSASMGFFKGPKNEFETGLVDELSVFKPLKCYYNCIASG